MPLGSMATGLVAGAGAIVALGVAWPAYWWFEIEHHIEKPKYTVLKRLGPKAELRLYAPYLIAETIIPADSRGMRGAMNSGFRSVAGFIFGGNERRESVSMTSPVRCEQIAMTSPVRSERATDAAGGGSAYKVSFVMPSKYTKQTIPSPKDSNVTVREVPAHVAAALPFRGASPDDAGWAQRQRDLEEEMRSNGLQPEGAVMMYQYYPPFAPGFIRLNEVLLRVANADVAAAEAEAAAAQTAVTHKDQ